MFHSLLILCVSSLHFVSPYRGLFDPKEWQVCCSIEPADISCNQRLPVKIEQKVEDNGPICKQAGYCESGWVYFDETESCYKAGYNLSYFEAENDCRNSEAHLTSIHGHKENAFVASLTKTNLLHRRVHEMTWIGLYKKGGTWLFSDGTLAHFRNWGPGEPNGLRGREECVQLYQDRHTTKYLKWNDTKCSTRMRAYVCKKEALRFDNP